MLVVLLCINCMITGHIFGIKSTNIYQVCILEPCQLLTKMGLWLGYVDELVKTLLALVCYDLELA